ncbi:hypothetical protein CABS01_12369 [Colletotrichum abscissum]|uniref:Uncharacterized protein n=1 Tax=Colletotrichum abscissum TaxID=1671311 RepID=A0A9P9XK15_9PEZI|nr:uncharacterized protein CABS01_12369 [Colletotrichum abscissum]KAI3555338.1 hypothetical protein CABS02_04438 [Colletotrichum abscissum]KAK1490569.1 hypothetical protein CABS01_12369 [Colletotrichum abscissum]
MAPASPSASTAAPKLPASADFNALYNRISLASAKQANFLTSMRAKYPSLARSSSSSTQATTSNNAAAPGTFSSMSKPTSSTETTTTATSTTSRPRAPADDADLRFENPNTGLGFATSKADQTTSAATRDLSRRLLGSKRGGGRAVDDPKALAAAALKKRRLQDDESDEEEGRGSWGKSKKKKTKVHQEEGESAGPEALVHPAARERGDVEMREGGLHDTEDQIHDNGQDSKEDAPIASPIQPEIAAMDPAEGDEADKRPETDEATKERKRNKKKRNKENKKNKMAAAAAAGGEGSVGAAQKISVA